MRIEVKYLSLYQHVEKILKLNDRQELWDISPLPFLGHRVGAQGGGTWRGHREGAQEGGTERGHREGHRQVHSEGHREGHREGHSEGHREEAQGGGTGTSCQMRKQTSYFIRLISLFHVNVFNVAFGIAVLIEMKVLNRIVM